MYRHEPRPESEWPEENLDEGLAFIDYVRPRDIRDLVHAERRVFRESVTNELSRIHPYLRSKDGISLFTINDYDSFATVFITDTERIAGKNNTIVVLNVERPAYQDEPHNPGGRTLKLVDVSISGNSKWLNTAWDELQRTKDAAAWDAPEKGTLLSYAGDVIEAYGNIRREGFVPKPARDLYDVRDDAVALGTIDSYLKLCTEITFVETITGMKSL